jgi:hypothetical protein
MQKIGIVSLKAGHTTIKKIGTVSLKAGQYNDE